ncbi:MAG: ArsC family transcriptional regulator [Oscillospiraceae bacterium]|nr:ArsC family transcriptional regulator [Oscillospiraceae bacterium]
MNIQIFGKSKCFDTKKAERFFKERHIRFQSVDLPSKGMSKRELESVIRAVGGIEQLVNPKDQDYPLFQHLLPDAQFEMLLETPEMLRTPIVRNGQQATVGEASAIWKKWIESEA